MDDVVSGAKQLMAYGIEADKVTDTMRRLGDVAAGLGLNLNDLAWLYGTTATQGKLFTQDFRQFTGRGIPLADELAKQFGVTKDKVQELVTAGKVGFPEVEKAIISMTDEGGKFGGLMENQSKSITGRISNIEDTIEQAINELGKSTEGIMYDSLDVITAIVEHWKEIGEAITAAAGAIGMYKAAMLSISTFQKSATNIGYDAEAGQLQSLLQARDEAHLSDLLSKDKEGTLSESELSELNALKEQSANADLQEAVASGKLTEAKAAQIAIMRQESEAYVEQLQLKAQAAQEDLATKSEDVVNAEQLLEKRQEELYIAQEADRQAQISLEMAQSKKDVIDEQVQAAKEYFDVVNDAEGGFGQDEQEEAAMELKAALEEQQAAATGLATAAEEANTAAQAVNTAETNLNTASTELNAATEAKATAATNAETASKQANTAAQQLNTAATAADTAKKGLWAQFTLLCKKAQDAWNASMFASPLFWIAATIAGVVYGVYKLATATSAAEEGQNAYNETMEKTNELIEERKNSIQSLINTIRSKDATSLDKQMAFNSLKELAPELTDVYDSVKKLEETDLSEFNQQVNELGNADREKAIRDQIKALQDLIKAANGSTPGMSYDGFSSEEIANIKEMMNSFGTHPLWMYDDYAEAAQQKLSLLQDDLQKIEDAKQQIEEPTEVDIQVANENYEKAKEKLDYLSDFIVAIQNRDVSIPFDASSVDAADAIIDELQRKVDAFKKEQEENPIAFTSDKQKSLAEYESMLSEMRQWKADAEANGDTAIPFYFQFDYERSKQAEQQAKSFRETIEAASTGSTNFATSFSAAKTAYEEAQKTYNQIMANKSGYTEKEFTDAKEALDAAKKAYANLGGETSKSNKNVDNKQKQAEKQRKNAEKQLGEALLALQQRNIDDEISLMQEGTEKKLREIQTDYDKRIAEIKKEEDNLKELNKKAKVSTLADGLTQEQRNALNSATTLAEKDRAKKVEEINKELHQSELKAMLDYLKEYGTIQEQMLALDKEYAEERKKILTSSELTDEQKRWQLASLEKQNQREGASINAQNLAMGIDWSKTFNGVGNVLRDIARETLDEINQYMKSDDFKRLSPESKKSYTELRDTLNGQVGNATSPFNFGQWDVIAKQTTIYQESVKKLKEATTAHTQAVEELKQAEADLANATDDKSREIAELAVGAAKQKVSATGQAQTTAQANAQAAEDDLVDSTNGAVQGMNNFQSALNNISSGSLKGFADGVTMLITSLSSGSNGIGKTLGELGGKIGGLVGAILSILDALGDDPSGFIDTVLSKLIDAIGGLMEQIASAELAEVLVKDIAKLLGTLIKGLLIDTTTNALKYMTFGKLDFTNITQWGSNAKEVQETIDRLTDRNEILTTAIDKLTDELSKSSGMKAVENAKEAEALQREKEQNLKEIAQAQASYSGAHHSFNANWGGFTQAQIRKFSQQIGRSWSGDIWDLSADEMALLLSNPDMVEEIKNTGKGDYGGRVLERLQDYADEAGELQDIIDTLNESLTQTTFDSLKSEFISSLMDMDTSAEDFADNFTEMLMQSVLNAKISDLLETDLNSFYDEWAERAKDGLSETDINYLQGKWAELTERGLQIRDEAAKVTGYTGETSQDATSGGWESMGQDTADELNGRFTALQIAGESIATNMVNVLAQMEALTSLEVSTNGAVGEIRNMMVMTNSYLEDVVKYAKLTYNDFGTKLDNIHTRLKEL